MKLWPITLLLGVGFSHWTVAIELIYGSLVLNIDNGTLTSVPTGASSDYIDLSGLQIKYIEKKTFDNLTNLKSLNLSNNNLSILPPLNKLKNLEELSVAHNKLEFLSGIFAGLNNLKHLDISNNLITDLNRGDLFRSTKSLYIIILGNSFEWLSSGTFEDPSLPALKFEKKPELPHLPMFGRNIRGKTSEASLPDDFRVKVCLTDGDLVESVEELKQNEELANCTQARMHRRKRTLDLSHSGLMKFQRGWYKLPDLINGLDLSENNILEVTPELLNELPSNVSFLDLGDNAIEMIKKNIIENKYCRSINLEFNSILAIEDGAFEKTNIALLSVANNRLTNLSFVGTLPLSIERLYLHGNAILEVPVNTFRGLKNLQIINLSDNYVEKIGSETFKDQEKLLGLDLSSNLISELKSGSFVGLKMVRMINLNNNKIKRIYRYTFSALKKLDGFGLRLGRNKIGTIEAGSFSNLNIISLDLSSNHITDESIAEGAFNKSTLAELDLSQNSIVKINGELFNGISGTYRLSLSENKIESIEKGAAKYMGNVSVLELSMNRLERLENGALYGLSKKKDVYVELFQVPIKVIQGGVFDDA